jgi:hypothetical protein
MFAAMMFPLGLETGVLPQHLIRQGQPAIFVGRA